MGKKLIIAGADFTANGINVVPKTWYLTLATDLLANKSNSPTNNSGSASWAFADSYNQILRGKTINLIRFIPGEAGTFNIYKTTSLGGSLGYPVAQITVSSDQVGVLTEYVIPNISIGNNDWLVFADQTCISFYYGSSANVPMPSGHWFYKRVGHSDNAVVNNYELLFDIGYQG